ncbi:protein phosphatase 2C domain-containing protein [Amycolatopsis sp. 195334CR]|uniref:protein phosphatase 2C domain-containing protein n=1 Tax=Amycolatopsis sp. 195334CR TaxID=2814588 RepID=UPI001A8F815B|nr:protein phosphatase 2C domain-containing protein [Amycolatopsis sp. 195334CR]MBN6039109.1 protein phosphatase 2C domain-containing protein [Amycolatopsis sp. 195334CR]
MSAVQVASAHLAGSDHSDDRTFSGANYVVMLDGASAFRPVPVPAAVYAQQLGSHLSTSLDANPQADLIRVLQSGIEATTAELDLRPGHSPSSTVTILRVLPERTDLLVLGDNLVVTPDELITDSRMDQLDLAPRHEYRDRLAAGEGYTEKHRELLRELQNQQAAARNREGGYWIAEAIPEAAEHAITRMWTTNRPAWFVLATDGAYEPMRHLGHDDWPSLAESSPEALQGILERCHDWESNTDPDAKALPRAKQHDDKSLTAVVATS